VSVKLWKKVEFVCKKNKDRCNFGHGRHGLCAGQHMCWLTSDFTFRFASSEGRSCSGLGVPSASSEAGSSRLEISPRITSGPMEDTDHFHVYCPLTTKLNSQAVTVDQDTAVLVKNQRSAVLTLVQQPQVGGDYSNIQMEELTVQVSPRTHALLHLSQLFFPSGDEEVVQVRNRIRLADNEAIILKDGEGRYHFRY